LLARLAQNTVYDIAIVGGGATGLGVALDAAARGLRVLLLESHDFAKGTSSRSTKLLHGGVRYLAQGNLSLVREALHERSTLLSNAAHLAQPLAFVVPVYQRWQQWFYGAGLTLYDLLAGSAGLGKTEFLSRAETLQLLPQVQSAGLCGGVKYWDAQFDDARLALALARTAACEGALLINYCPVTVLNYAAGKLDGLTVQDSLSGQSYQVRARCVVNATGVWVDALRALDGPAHQAGGGWAVRPMVAPSQGIHLVVERDFLESDAALMVPKTEDGRVMFVLPWLGKLILGTTDTPRHNLAREPKAFAAEVDFLLREAGRYLRRAPTRADIKSIWVGLRPLVKPQHAQGDHTEAISREHAVLVSRSGLVTVTGGKWTTYRAMAEDVLSRCAAEGLIASNLPGRTQHLALVGAPTPGAMAVAMHKPPGAQAYGSEWPCVLDLPGADRWLVPGLSEAMVRFAARYEYAVTVEDVLARRARLLFLDAALAVAAAEKTGAILRDETGLNPQIDEFLQLATQYLQIP
jgi:glycerol-3-phosphate dehydrogenase